MVSVRKRFPGFFTVFFLFFLFALSFTSTSSWANDKMAAVELNSASASQLESIPGIGSKKAEAIVSYRDANGPFKSVADITKVKGIGPKMLEKIKDHLTLGTVAPAAPPSNAPASETKVK